MDERAKEREREGTRVWCNALRENTISGGFLRSFPPLHPPFSFLPAFPPFHFSSRVTPTFCHRLVKLRKVMEQRILRLTRKVINVTCTMGKARMLSLLRKYAPFIALFFELIGDRWTWSITGIGQVCLDI